MYQINYSEIDGSTLNVNVTIFLNEKERITCNVPVKDPKGKEDVIREIEKRENAEIAQFTAAPVLNAIKDELALNLSGKLSTSSDFKAAASRRV